MDTKRYDRQRFIDTFFYQYIIKTEVPSSEEDNSNVSYDLYNKYKNSLQSVIHTIEEHKSRQDKNEEEMKTKDAAKQFEILQRDILLVSQASVFDNAKTLTMTSLAQKYKHFQDQLMKISQHSGDFTSERGTTHDPTEKSKKDKREDNDDMKLEDKEESESASESDSEGEDKLSDDSDFEDDVSVNDIHDEQSADDKIVNITGNLPTSFEQTNMISDDREQNRTVVDDEQSSIHPIEYFHKSNEWGWLSTFHQANPFTFRGRGFATVEHAFNAQKSESEDYKDLFTLHSATYIGDDALTARTKGSKKAFETSQFALRGDWEKVRVDILRDCMEAYFLENPDIKEKIIIQTKTYPLHHTGFKVGTFWGMQKGKGKNIHGKLLMEFRKRWTATNDVIDTE